MEKKSIYKKEVERCRDTDLSLIGCYYPIDWDYVGEDERRILKRLGIFEGETDSISALDAERYDLYQCVDMYLADYEDADIEIAETMSGLIKDAPHYLVMAHGCRWNGDSGYKIVHSIEDTIKRGYDVSIYPLNVSGGGKCLLCKEYSHDVPMGSITSIIALTEREFAFLDHWDTGWDAVASFAAKCEARCDI